MKNQFAIVAVLAAVSFSAQAFAAAPVAVVGAASGKVLVNQGKGFVPLAEGAALFVGDKVFVGKDGKATISYTEAKCTVDVAPASVSQVLAAAPCTEGETVAAVDSVFVKSASHMYLYEGEALPLPVVLALGGIVGLTAWAIIDQDGGSVSAP